MRLGSVFPGIVATTLHYEDCVSKSDRYRAGLANAYNNGWPNDTRRNALGVARHGNLDQAIRWCGKRLKLGVKPIASGSDAVCCAVGLRGSVTGAKVNQSLHVVLHESGIELLEQTNGR